MKDSLILSLIAVLIMLSLQDPSIAQSGGASRNRIKYDGALEYHFNLMQSMPTIPLGAPPDVTAGYLYLQYLAENYSTHSIDSAFSRMTYSDTLKTLVKYIYELDDYDPVTFHRFLYSHIPSVLRKPAYISEVALQHQARILYPDSERTQFLTWTDVIAHVTVTGTMHHYDTAVQFSHHRVLVNAQILDLVKGQTVPSCLFWELITHSKRQTPLEDDSTEVLEGPSGPVPSDSGACVQWEYGADGLMRGDPHGDLHTHELHIVNADGSDWVQTGKEYIVFLRLNDYGYDTATDFCTIWNSSYGAYAGMYPVVSGQVQDPYDDFGFGPNLPVADFMTALRNKVYSIEHP